MHYAVKQEQRVSWVSFDESRTCVLDVGDWILPNSRRIRQTNPAP